MPSYILRLHSDTDTALWVRFKQRAQQDGVPMRALMLKLIEAYADGRVSVSVRRDPAGSPR